MAIGKSELVERRVSSSESESETSDEEDDLLVNLNPRMKFKSRDNSTWGQLVLHRNCAFAHERLCKRGECTGRIPQFHSNHAVRKKRVGG